MQQSRFTVLTGHLNDYPLGDLVGILRHQHKTGRLLIEYEAGPAMLFFKDGELVDAQLNKLAGLQAVCVALAQSPASFNFNPMISPSRRSIEPGLQRTVSELLGCWDEDAIAIESAKTVAELPIARDDVPVLVPPVSPKPLLEASNEVLAPTMPRLLEPAPAPSQSRFGLIGLTVAVAGILIVALSTLTGTSGSTTALSNPSSDTTTRTSEKQAQAPATDLKKNEGRSEARSSREATKLSQKVTTPSEPAKADERAATKEKEKVETPQAPTEARKQPETSGHLVKVVVQVAEGRVTRAAIGNHAPGMDAYEALALRIARQRRYPANAAGQQVITIKVNQP